MFSSWIAMHLHPPCDQTSLRHRTGVIWEVWLWYGEFTFNHDFTASEFHHHARFLQSNFHMPFLMELGMVVLECLVQIMTWSPHASMILPHEQCSCRSGHRGTPSLRFRITVNSSFCLRFSGSSRLMSVKKAGILGSSRSSSRDIAGKSCLTCRA